VNGPSHYVKGEELAEHAEDLIKQGRPGARLGGPRAGARHARPGCGRGARDVVPRRAQLGRRRPDQVHRPRPGTLRHAISRPAAWPPGRIAPRKPGTPSPPLSTTCSFGARRLQLSSAGRVGSCRRGRAADRPTRVLPDMRVVTHGDSSAIMRHAISALCIAAGVWADPRAPAQSRTVRVHLRATVNPGHAD
jgi:hypothetical protein